MGFVDLHVHSCRSDGTMTPRELVDYAIEKGLEAVALTDHDTVDGLDEMIAYAKRNRLRLFPESSTRPSTITVMCILWGYL